MNDEVLACSGLAKTYGMGNVAVPVLKGIDLVVRGGESLAIVGASGSGKSTLLHLLGGLDRPTEGSVKLLGEDLFALDPRAQGLLRNRALGFVYQFHHLLPEFSALENVAMPLLIRRMEDKPAYERAAAMLGEVGLGHRLAHRPGELSGGERQRVAIARALANEPAVLLADEPTGSLDSVSVDRVLALFRHLRAERAVTIVMVTHDQAVAAAADRIVAMSDGRIVAP